MTRTLTYPDLVDPAPGTLMGPSTDGRWFRVVGTEHSAGKSLVTFEIAEAA